MLEDREGIVTVTYTIPSLLIFGAENITVRACSDYEAIYHACRVIWDRHPEAGTVNGQFLQWTN